MTEGLVMGKTFGVLLSSRRWIELERLPWIGLAIALVGLVGELYGSADCSYPSFAPLGRAGRGVQSLTSVKTSLCPQGSDQACASHGQPELLQSSIHFVTSWIALAIIGGSPLYPFSLWRDISYISK